MSKQTSVVELPNAHAENFVGKSVAVKRKRGRPAKQTRAKVDETAETTSTSAEHSCGKSTAAKRGKHTKHMSTTDAKAFTLEELQNEDGGWFTIKPAVKIAALCWDLYSYHRCVDCRMRAPPNGEGGMVVLNAPLRRRRKYTACVFYCAKRILICGSLLRRRCRADYGCFCGRVQRFQRRGKEENRLEDTRNEM